MNIKNEEFLVKVQIISDIMRNRQERLCIDVIGCKHKLYYSIESIMRLNNPNNRSFKDDYISIYKHVTNEQYLFFLIRSDRIRLDCSLYMDRPRVIDYSAWKNIGVY